MARTRFELGITGLFCAWAFFAAVPVATAQDSPTHAATATEDGEETPEVVVQGWRRDRAMEMLLKLPQQPGRRRSNEEANVVRSLATEWVPRGSIGPAGGSR